MIWTWLDEVLADAIVVTDAEQQIRFFNAAAERLWGYKASEVLGRPLWLLLPMRAQARHDGHVERFARGELDVCRMGQRTPVFGRRRDGAEVPCDVSVARLRDEQGFSYVAVVRDRSELQRVHRVARTGAWDWDVVQGHLYWSDEALQLLGLPGRVSEDPGAELLPRVLAEDQARVAEALRQARTASSTWQLEFRLRSEGGGAREVRLVGDASRDEHGRTLRLMGTVRDVTDERQAARALERSAEALRQTEARLQQAQRLETMGQLASGLAHDFGNFLSVILSAAGELRRELAADHPLQEEALDIEQAAERGAALTRQLLAFSKPQPWRPTVVDVAAAVRGLARPLQRVMREHHRVTLDVPSSARVHIDPTHLDQVLLNLAVNARDAMPQGGTLAISAALDAEAREVHLRVADTGQGIAPEHLPRIFEPFFTTKGATSGTGLGLASCYGIVKQAGGRIEVQSVLERGTTFELVLPLVEPARAASAEQAKQVDA